MGEVNRINQIKIGEILKINSYYAQLNTRSQEIFALAQEEPELLSKVHSSAAELSQLSEVIFDLDEKSMLRVVCSQLESSCLSLSLGLYRPAIGALRLALELGIGSIYFSANKMAHREWISGNGDLKWSVVNSEFDGVFSHRFTKAFFPELIEHSGVYLTRASRVYRTLSEYVHGNSDTWNKSGIVLQANEELRKFYELQFDEVTMLLKFAFCCRHLKEMSSEYRESNHAILIELSYIPQIREFLGGPKEIS